MRRFQPFRSTLAAALLLAPMPFLLGSSDDEPPPATTRGICRWAVEPPKLDGKLDDPAWEAAAVIDNFPTFWDKKDNGKTTRARLLWNMDSLFIAATMTDAEIKSFGTRHNDHLWNGDVFELFLKPSPDRPEYFEFQANPKGTVFECAFEGRGKIPPDFSKTPVLGNKAAIALKGTLDKPGDADISWAVEGKIPWTAFAIGGGKPKADAIWSFAFCRYDYGPEKGKEVLMSSAPLTIKNFHHYEDYGKLKFIGPKK